MGKSAKPASTPPIERPSDAPDTAQKRDHHGDRSTPPPAQFDLDELAGSALLSEREIAAVMRVAVSTVQTWRRRKHPLKWLVVGGGRVRYRVADLREFLTSGGNRGRPRKKDSATALRRARRMKADNPTTAQEAP
jgi:hypothetical protein